MFEARLKKVDLFRNSLEAIAELASEGTFKLTKEGIFLTVADPTMVTLISFKFLSTLFDVYKVEKPQNMSISIDNLLTILKRARPHDVVHLTLDNEINKLVVELKGTSSRRFTLPLIEIEESEIPEMNLDFPATIELKTEVLEDGVGDASIVTDTLVLNANKDSFSVIAEGDLSKVHLVLDKKSHGLKNIETRSEVKSKFSLDYFKKIMKAAKLSEDVTIHLGVDYPVKLVFREVDKFELSYILAPRVED